MDEIFVPAEQQYTEAWQAVAEYLRKKGYHLDLNQEIRQFASGVANVNYLMTIDGQKTVLRRPPKGPLAPGASQVGREYKVLSHIGEKYPYAPKAIHYCEDPSVIGVPFCISEFRAGVPIGVELPETLTDVPNIGERLSRISLDALAELHSIDPEQVGLSTLGKAEGFLDRQVEGWAKRSVRALSGENMKIADRVIDWLRNHKPEYRPSSIVHNDFKLNNMLIDLNSLEVKAVLDWDMCTIGDPLYDLMIMMCYWGEPDDDELYEDLARMPYKAEGWLTRREACAYYLERAPLEMTESARKFYWVLVLFRIAIVFAQLLKLYETGSLKSGVIHGKNENEWRARIHSILQAAASQTQKSMEW